MTLLAKQLEALLFASGKPIGKGRLVSILKTDAEMLDGAVQEVVDHLNASSGLRLLVTEKELAIGTDPELADFIRDQLRKDVIGELTKPSVETLAIIAYRGPITKPEIEQIRGVNCTMILRNLMIRGLIDEVEGERKMLYYSVSMQYLQHLGVSSTPELPDYEDLAGHALLDAITKTTQKED